MRKVYVEPVPAYHPIGNSENAWSAVKSALWRSHRHHINVGAAFRAAAGLGADAVLISPRCADPLYRRSVRVSMGTVFQVPWTRIGDWSEAAPALHELGFDMAALALSDDAVALDAYSVSRPERVALVMGTEGDGLTAEAIDAADAVVTIPMRGGVDSLNVASAAAVALWEMTRG